MGAIGLVLLQYLARLDLSRSFTVLLVVFSWILLCLFRLMSGQMVGYIRRRFGATHFVLVVGSGERARKVEELLNSSAVYGIRLMAIVNEQSAYTEVPRLLRQHI